VRQFGECEERGRESVPSEQFDDEVTEILDTSTKQSLIHFCTTDLPWIPDLVLLLDEQEAVPDLEEGANEVKEFVHGKRMAAEDRHGTELSQLKSRNTDATGSPSLPAALRMKVVLLTKTEQRFRHRATAAGALRLDQPRFQVNLLMSERVLNK
jgi:hypothetical protein